MANQQIQIKARDEELKGAYSNLMEVKHTKEEFCLDFMTVFPPIGALTARVITSPGHLKRMIAALVDNLDKYESSYGSVSAAPAPEKAGEGFQVK